MSGKSHGEIPHFESSIAFLNGCWNEGASYSLNLPSGVRNAYIAAIRRPSPQTVKAATESGGDIDVLFDDRGSAANSEILSTLSHHAVADSVTTDLIKRRTLGNSGSTVGSNALIARDRSLHAWRAANILYADYDNARDALNWCGSIAWQIANKDIPNISWMAYRWAQFSEATRDNLAVAKQLNNYETLSSSEIASMREDNDQLWQELTALRKYGVKPVIVPSLSNGHFKEWLVEDPETHTGLSRSSQVSQVNFAGTEAVFSGATQSFITSRRDVKMLEQSKARIKGGYTHVSDLFGENVGDVELSTIFLRRDGQLLDGGSVEIGEVAKRIGAEGEYEQLRSEILSIYFDMVTPVYIHDLAEPIQRSASSQPEQTSTPKHRGKLRELVLRRTRVLREIGPDIVEAMELDLQEASAKAEAVTTSRTKHTVVGYVHAIPAHHRASRQARELCRQNLGYELADFGETYTKTHERGSVEVDKPKGHKARMTKTAKKYKKRRG